MIGSEVNRFLGDFDSIGHENGRMEPQEFVVIGEEEGLSFLYKVLDSNVEHDDSCMGLREFGSELATDVVTIEPQFISAVREGKSDSTGGKVPH